MGSVFSHEPTVQENVHPTVQNSTPTVFDFGDSTRTALLTPMHVQKTRRIINPVSAEKTSIRLDCDRRGLSCCALTFELNSKTPAEVNIHFLAKESISTTTNGMNLNITSQFRVTRRCEADIKNQFKQENIDLSRFDLEDLQRKPKHTRAAGEQVGGNEEHPVVIHLKEINDNLDATNLQSQYTFCALDTQVTQGTTQYKVIPYSQKHQYGGNIYDLHEMYGVEDNRRPEQTSAVSGIPNGRECVICLAAERDTTVLPCRHMCLCSECANIMRMQSKTCPVCRQKVESLIQIPDETTQNEEGLS